MAARGLLDLPVELLLQTLRLLQLADLFRSRATCRTIRDTVKRSLELQYFIELAADNLVDGPWGPGSLTTAARLDLLLDRRRRWRQLVWNKTETISFPGTCQAYELVGGVFAKSTCTGAATSVGSRHLIMTWLPSRTEDTHSITREDLGISSRDFAIDPTQDLIALVVISVSEGFDLKVKVFLRTMSQNTPHPDAAKPHLSAIIPFHIGSCFVQIVDDIVGMFFWVHGPGFVIWNWRTGEQIVVRHNYDVQRILPPADAPFPPPERTNVLPPGTWDFGFISSRAFMLTTVDGPGSIELFTFNGNSTSDTPIHVASLRLPQLQEGRELISITTHSAPFLTHPERPNGPFYANQVERIHALSLRYVDRGGLRIVMIVKNNFLLRFVSSSLNASGKQAQKLIVPWEQWGPQNTRFMDCLIRSSWLRYVHGQRIVLPDLPIVPSPDDDGKVSATEALQPVRVIDFNCHPKRIDDPCDCLVNNVDATSSRDPGKYQVVSQPTIVPKGDIFAADVETRLPYSMVTRLFSADYTGFMIDDERLVGMKHTAFAEFSSPTDRDMDVFVF